MISKNKKFVIKKPSRKFFFYFMWLIALPITLILISIISSYNINKIEPFSEYTNEYEVTKIKGSKFTDFTFEFYCSDFRNASSTTLTFKAAAYDETVLGTISSINYTVSVGSNWTGYLSADSSTKVLTLGTLDDYSYGSVSVVNFEQKYPIYGYPYIWVQYPTAYVYLTYTTNYIGNSTSNHYILTYTYDEYFTSQTLGGL